MGFIVNLALRMLEYFSTESASARLLGSSDGTENVSFGFLPPCLHQSMGDYENYTNRAGVLGRAGFCGGCTGSKHAVCRE